MSVPDAQPPLERETWGEEFLGATRILRKIAFPIVVVIWLLLLTSQSCSYDSRIDYQRERLDAIGAPR